MMGQLLSKEARFWGINKILDGIKYFYQLQDAMIEIEAGEGNTPAVLELFSTYITQKASAIAGKPLWLCCMGFNEVLFSVDC